MEKRMMKRHLRTAGFLALALLALAACTWQPEWKAKNDRLIKEQGLSVRTRDDIPESRLVPSLADGVMAVVDNLPVTELAPGIKGRLYWGKGVLVNWMILEPGAERPAEPTAEERLFVVMKGTIMLAVNGETAALKAVPRDEPDGTHGRTPKNDLVYLDKGSTCGFVAGEQGAEILEIASPPPLPVLRQAGTKGLPSKLPDTGSSIPPSLEPKRIRDLNDIQYTLLVPGAHSRLVSGRNFQASFLRMDPGSTFAAHLHPEEQLMIVLRGSIDELILDGTATMRKGDIVRLPADMVHGGTIGPEGCDVLDVFWPVRPDYEEKRVRTLQAFHAVIPEDAEIELFVDGAKTSPGLVFGEGPKWLKDKLYLSSMFFDQKWAGDPKKSSLVEVDPDGTYRQISRGEMQTNGIVPLANGNLAVCDMFGHRVIEMTTRGRIVRTLASVFDGKPLDGPNDIVTDAKGGIYFTDPQFTPETKKSQPGRAVYYLPPGGELIRIIEPDTFGMPNGVVLSPDGKTLYINNTYDDESWWNVNSDKDQWVWAFDVQDDGTVKNGRRFAELTLIPSVLDRKGRSSGADGMTIDEAGNLYVATYMGLQIFDPQGRFLGMLNTPVYPVNICFGGDDFKTLYLVGYDKIFRVRTNVKGLRYGPR